MQWVNVRETAGRVRLQPRVRAAACEALGNLAAIVSQDTLQTSFNKISTTIINVLKREKLKEELPIIQVCFLEGPSLGSPPFARIRGNLLPPPPPGALGEGQPAPAFD